MALRWITIIAASRSPSALFDITHNFKFGGVWELPFGKGRTFMTGAAR